MKRFLLRTFLGAIPVLIVVGLTVYYWFAVRPELSGDLGQLGKLKLSRDYSEAFSSPRFDSLMVSRYREGDPAARILTVGDSFSQQGMNGYQNFLAHSIGDTISNLVVRRGDWMSPEQGVADLLNRGFFDNHPEIEVVILETVEREFPWRWDKIETDRQAAESPVLDPSLDNPHEEKPLTVQNYLSTIFRQGSDWLRLTAGLDKSPVKHVELKDEYFTLPGHESELYFYQDDLVFTDLEDAEIRKFAGNMRTLQRRLAEKGVTLVCLIAPDKYELYQHYAVDGRYPYRPLGERLMALDSLEFVVNPLPQLTAALRAGEKDLFMADDTHWSYKSASIAAGLLENRIDSLRGAAGN